MLDSRHRKFSALFLAFLLAAGSSDLVRPGSANATSPPGDGGPEASREIELPGERVFPEGVAIDDATDQIYVGSTEDGTIFRADLDAERADVFLPPGENGRTSVTGLAVDGDRLFIAGRGTGRIFVYDTETRELVGGFDTSTGDDALMNDVTVAGDAAFVTDSFRPVLWRLDISADDVAEPQPWIDLDGSPIAYGEGFNLNGITSDQEGTTLLVVHYGTGELFRIDIATQTIDQVDLAGDLLVGGDGLELDRTTLYAITGDELVTVELDAELRTGTVADRETLDGLAYPTTLAFTEDAFVIVNSQLDMTGNNGEPTIPFTVSVLPRP